ncbi:MAG: NAD(P)-dependent oxidoreductase [Candidatus Omnitrophica bacterium]|nr:NAD(P)-dependent oxidoreductase [Candidatus Omnitrophota bacterium]
MKIFITGANGFIGKELIRQSRQAGIHVSGIDLLAGNNPDFVTGDIRDIDLKEKIPEGIDAIVHLAALSRDADCKNNVSACFNVNVMGTLNLINAAHEKKAKQFIFASTEWVYGGCWEARRYKIEKFHIDPQNLSSEYALSKLVSECNLRQRYAYGFCPVTILRFGIVYGPRLTNWSAVESLFNDCATKNEITVGSLKTGRHFIHVSDIASAIIKSIGIKGFEIINIQADKLTTLGDIIKTSKKLLGRKFLITESSPDQPSIRKISNKKAKDLLGWVPLIDIEDGLKSVKEFLKL